MRQLRLSIFGKASTLLTAVLGNSTASIHRKRFLNKLTHTRLQRLQDCESVLGRVPRLAVAQLYTWHGLATAMRVSFVCTLLFEDSHARWQCRVMNSGGQVIPHYFCFLSYDKSTACRKVKPLLINWWQRRISVALHSSEELKMLTVVR